jgi:hypothetical protein
VRKFVAVLRPLALSFVLAFVSDLCQRLDLARYLRRSFRLCLAQIEGRLQI